MSIDTAGGNRLVIQPIDSNSADFGLRWVGGAPPISKNVLLRKKLAPLQRCQLTTRIQQEKRKKWAADRHTHPFGADRLRDKVVKRVVVMKRGHRENLFGLINFRRRLSLCFFHEKNTTPNALDHIHYTSPTTSKCTFDMNNA